MTSEACVASPNRPTERGSSSGSNTPSAGQYRDEHGRIEIRKPARCGSHAAFQHLGHVLARQTTRMGVFEQRPDDCCLDQREPFRVQYGEPLRRFLKRSQFLSPKLRPV
jgi:hypothetical protein